MSVIAAALPTAVSVARPLIGLSLLAAFLLAFKPLLAGLLRAAVLSLKPASDAGDDARRKLKSIRMLHRMADSVEHLQPNQAKELRGLAARD